MKAVWKQGGATKDWFADYRGISTRVRVDPESGKATEFRGIYRARSRWFHPSELPWMWQNESPTKVIEHQIASEAKWKAAETRYQRGFSYGAKCRTHARRDLDFSASSRREVRLKSSRREGMFYCQAANIKICDSNKLFLDPPLQKAAEFSGVAGEFRCHSQPLLCYQGRELLNPHHWRRAPFAGQRFGLRSIEAHGQVEGPLRSRKPVGFLACTRALVLEIKVE